VTESNMAAEEHTDEESAVAHHDPVTHMDKHAALSDDDHGHAETPLGPIDWKAWGYALLGGLGGVAVLLFMGIAVAPLS
jgi:hypothetical protein